jgi:hypothetical protein
LAFRLAIIHGGLLTIKSNFAGVLFYFIRNWKFSFFVASATKLWIFCMPKVAALVEHVSTACLLISTA